MNREGQVWSDGNETVLIVRTKKNTRRKDYGVRFHHYVIYLHSIDDSIDFSELLEYWGESLANPWESFRNEMTRIV